MHPAAFRITYPDRRINNIYFDDHQLSSYQDNLIGTANREKLRLRWYGETGEPKQAVMELKAKKNKLGWKKRAAIDLNDIPLQGLPIDELTSRLKDRLPPDLRLKLELRDCPVTYNRYRRSYFEDATGLIRLTLDKDLAFQDLQVKTRLTFDDCQTCEGFGILEIKFSSMDDLAGIDVIRDLDLRMTKFSKYVFGLRKETVLG